MIQKIISGGQTGVDRAALDWAIRNGVAHGGFCPKGRRSEDGMIPEIYQLKELPSRSYLLRTESNVLAADGTVLITRNRKLTGGSLRTAQYCRKAAKPLLHLFEGIENPSRWLCAFIEEHKVAILNVAGSRESTSPGIGDFASHILEEAFGGSDPCSLVSTKMRAVGSEHLGARLTLQPNRLRRLFLLTAEADQVGRTLISEARHLSQELKKTPLCSDSEDLIDTAAAGQMTMVNAISQLMSECFPPDESSTDTNSKNA